MGRKPKQYKYMKSNDGRKNNGRKKGETYKHLKPAAATPSALNQAKKDRIQLSALNAIVKEYGSEQDFWNFVASQSKDSFPHLKMLMEYKYGKPEDQIYNQEKPKVNINIKNLFTGNQELPEADETIDIPFEEDEDTDNQSEV